MQRDLIKINRKLDCKDPFDAVAVDTYLSHLRRRFEIDTINYIETSVNSEGKEEIKFVFSKKEE